MRELLRAIADPTRRRQPALVGQGDPIRYGELAAAVPRLADAFVAYAVRRLGLSADNGPAWVLADLAAQAAGVTLVPLPSFFSEAQLAHVVTAAELDHVLEPAEARQGHALSLLDASFRCRQLGEARPSDLAKVTFTSGTTGRPKGVRLAADTLESVALALFERLAPLRIRTHLAALPLATLLENVAGIYVPLLSGACIHLPPLRELGYSGASGLDFRRFAETVRRRRPESLILVPHLLQALVATAEAGLTPPDSLRFLAVGGGRVAPTLLARARAVGLPAYEGYGLSETGSVVALNVPGEERAGSVGRPLEHLRLELAEDGEILVHGPRFRGYLGDAPPAAEEQGPVATGDLGYLDADGFLHLAGRKKNIFITAYGRNVAPEWVESELTAEAPIAQAAVFGEARPWCAAVIASAAGEEAVAAAVARANSRLPDYARIGAWIRADAAFSATRGEFTANGRLRRPAIWAAYEAAVNALYE